MKKLFIGLTGPSGSGKSTVAALMRSWGGVEVLDCDAIAHRVMESDPACLAALTGAFSPAILREDGSLDRKALGSTVFYDAKKLQKLGEISYPYIIAECERLAEAALRAGARACVLDAPTLFESGADALCHTVISVITPREQRLRRILLRDGITREAAKARMQNQFEDEYYAARSDFVIRNTADLRHLMAETERCRIFLKL